MSSPLDQFLVQTWIPIQWGALDLSLTNSAFFMILAAVLSVLIPYALLVSPYRILVLEVFEFIRELTRQYVGQTQYFPIMLSLFLFLAMVNLLGIIPGAFTATSHISVTLTLAVGMYIFVIICGLYKQGWGFFRIFFPRSVPVFLAPLLIPIEIVSFFTKPISLAIRLFANMLAGHIMVKIFAGFVILLQFGIFSILPVGINVILVAFEVFVAILQAYVFTLLTCLYLHDVLHLH